MLNDRLVSKGNRSVRLKLQSIFQHTHTLYTTSIHVKHLFIAMTAIIHSIFIVEAFYLTL